MALNLATILRKRARRDPARSGPGRPFEGLLDPEHASPAPAYRYPRSIEFRDQLPESACGKILKQPLEQEPHPAEPRKVGTNAREGTAS